MLKTDSVTKTEYFAAPTTVAKAQAILAALANPVTVEVRNGANEVVGTGTMDTPWATVEGHVLRITDAYSFEVTVTGTPDASWKLRLSSGSRWLEGSFGLEGSDAAFLWSLPTWEAGQVGRFSTTLIYSWQGVAERTFSDFWDIRGQDVVVFGWLNNTTKNIGSFQTGVGGTYDLKQDASIPVTRTPSFTVTSTPQTGINVDQNTGILSIASDLTAGNYSVTVFLADVTQPEPPQGVDLVNITLVADDITSWTCGHAFRQGDVTQHLTADSEQFQANVLNYWPDGSVKYAILSGRSSPGIIKVKTTATASTGTTVPEINVNDVGDTYVLIDGVRINLVDAINGSDHRNLSGVLGTRPATPGRFRDWVSGPVMRETHYYAPVPNKAGMAVVWYVRKYASGQVEIETAVENGFFGITAASQSYTCSVVIAGNTKPWSDGVSTRPITHDVYRRWSRIDWVGTDTNYYILHDTSYLTNTRLVPNYGWPVSTSEQALTVAQNNGRTLASVTDAEVKAPIPFSIAMWRSPQNKGGEEMYGQIGLIPGWECLYLRTHDLRALRSILWNARCWQHIPTWRRDERTLKMPRTDATTNFAYSNSLAEREHQPSTGYLAYLLTGRAYFLETCQNTALWNFFKTNPANPWPVGGGVGRGGLRGILVSGELAERAIAWPWRSLVTATTITPDSDPLRADLKYCVEQNIEYFWGLQRDNTGMANNLGVVWSANRDSYYSSSYLNTGIRVYGDPVGTPTAYMTHNGWMAAFLSSAIGFTRGLGLVTGQSATDLASLHAFSVKPFIEKLGNAFDDSGYSWKRASTYKEPCGYPVNKTVDAGSSTFRAPESFFPSWRHAYEHNLAYWGAIDFDDSDPVNQSPFDVWQSPSASFVSGFDPSTTPADIERANSVDAFAGRIFTRTFFAPLAFGVDYNVPGALAAYNKLLNFNVVRSNATARQLMADAPKYIPTPR